MPDPVDMLEARARKLHELHERSAQLAYYIGATRSLIRSGAVPVIPASLDIGRATEELADIFEATSALGVR